MKDFIVKKSIIQEIIAEIVNYSYFNQFYFVK